MLVVAVHPWRENFEQIDIEYSEDMVRRLINRQTVYVLLAQNAHREAQREKREATKAICGTQSGEARLARPTPVAAIVSNGASVANRNGEPEAFADGTPRAKVTIFFRK